jgi:hypothetical protein
MLRVDLHIIRARRGWQLQNANERTLAVFRSVDAAQEHGEARARQLRTRGLNVRVTVHEPGKAPKVFFFPAQTAPVESYALTRCRLA